MPEHTAIDCLAGCSSVWVPLGICAWWSRLVCRSFAGQGMIDTDCTAAGVTDKLGIERLVDAAGSCYD